MTTFYASSVATGANNGTSWADALTDLQAALNALQSGDHLHLDAPETKPWRGGYNLASRNGWTIDCNQGPSGATWLRGGILYNDWTAAGAVFSRAMPVAPRYVAYDFKRDTVQGAATGVNLTLERPAQWLAELGREAEDAVAWYGFLKPAAAPTASPADGEWSHTGGTLYVNPPGSPTLSDFTTKCEPCVTSTNAILLNFCNDFSFNGQGLTGILYPDFNSNAGYIVKANNCARSTIRGARGIAVGWHGFGFAAASRERCRLEDLLVVGQTMSDGVGSVANPYVIAGDGAAGPADARFTRLAAVMHAPARHDGQPMFNNQGRYDAVLLISHTTSSGDYLPVRADRTLLLDCSHLQAARHGLTLPNSGGRIYSGSAAVGQPESLAGWGIVVADSKTWGRAAVPAPGIACDGCVFDRAGQGAADSPLIGLTGSLKMYLRRCFIATGRHTLGYFSSLDADDLIVLDRCEIIIETDIGTHEPLAYANSSTPVLKLIETSIRSVTPNATVLLQTGNSSFSTAHLAVASGGLNRIDASIPNAARANNLAFTFKTWDWWRSNVAGASADRSAMILATGRLRGDWTRRHDMLNDDDVRQLAAAILANPDRRLVLTAAGEVTTDAASRTASRADVSGLAKSAEVGALLAPIAAAGDAAAGAQAAAESADAKLDDVAERTTRLPDEPAAKGDVAAPTQTGPRTLTVAATADGEPAGSLPVHVHRGGSYYAKLVTDAAGYASVPVEDATYRLAVTAAGYAALVQDVTVDGTDVTATLELDALAAPVAPPGRSAGTLRIFDGGGEPAASCALHLRLTAVASDDHGLNVYKSAPLTVTTDEAGAATLTLLRAATYEVYRTLNGPQAELVVPDAPTFTAPDLVL